MEDQNYITPIDQFVIDFILSLRNTKKLSQQKIADLLGVKRSFIGNLESTNNRAKYNVRHINILADYFDLSPRDFLPENPLEHYYPGREKTPKTRASKISAVKKNRTVKSIANKKTTGRKKRK